MVYGKRSRRFKISICSSIDYGIIFNYSLFSKARTTAEMVLRSSDKTVYYDYASYSIPRDTSGNRIVGYETIIPTLYKYDKERYKVTFKQGNYNETTGELSKCNKSFNI